MITSSYDLVLLRYTLGSTAIMTSDPIVPNPLRSAIRDNQIRNNTFDTDYRGSYLKTFDYVQDDYASGCEKPTPNSVRLRTSGNVRK